MELNGEAEPKREGERRYNLNGENVLRNEEKSVSVNLTIRAELSGNWRKINGSIGWKNEVEEKYSLKSGPTLQLGPSFSWLLLRVEVALILIWKGKEKQ